MGEGACLSRVPVPTLADPRVLCDHTPSELDPKRHACVVTLGHMSGHNGARPLPHSCRATVHLTWHLLQAIYFTALFSYLVLTIFLVRGLMLPGVTHRLCYLFTPNVSGGGRGHSGQGRRASGSRQGWGKDFGLGCVDQCTCRKSRC